MDIDIYQNTTIAVCFRIRCAVEYIRHERNMKYSTYAHNMPFVYKSFINRTSPRNELISESLFIDIVKSIQTL